jgi:hypothetical protein
LTLPVSKYRLEGATSFRIFLPETLNSDWFPLISSSALVPRTKPKPHPLLICWRSTRVTFLLTMSLRSPEDQAARANCSSAILVGAPFHESEQLGSHARPPRRLQTPVGIALSVQRALCAVQTALRCFLPKSEHPLSKRPRMLQHPRTCSLLQSPTGTRPPPGQPVASLLGFGPFQRLQPWKPGHLGFASPDTFRLQGFAPSCRLTSSAAFRPCFMPVTLLGFPFRAFSPRRAFGPFRNQ